jgi:hypothetical protein
MADSISQRDEPQALLVAEAKILHDASFAGTSRVRVKFRASGSRNPHGSGSGVIVTHYDVRQWLFPAARTFRHRDWGGN